MRRGALTFLAMAMVLGVLAPMVRAQQTQEEVAPSASASRFVAYPTFRPVFHNQSETFSILANIYVVNAAAASLKDVTFKQSFPPELKPRLAPEAMQAQLSYPPEFWQKIENSTYSMFLPRLVRRQPAVILSELSLERRMSTFNIPATQVEFTLPEGPGKEETLPMSVNFGEYANHVGDLNRFLRKKAGIGLDVTVSGRDGWEFAPPDAVATGRNPEGVIGVETRDEGYSGNFRLHNGVPGDALDILVVWKSTQKDECLKDGAAAQKELSEYLKWTGPFRFDPEDSKIAKGKFKKYDAWVLQGRWVDSIPKHLGSGPVKALAFYSPREDVEYYLIFSGQGRGAGPDHADNPAPEKDAALLQTLEKILDTFKSEIVPISTSR